MCVGAEQKFSLHSNLKKLLYGDRYVRIGSYKKKTALRGPVFFLSHLFTAFQPEKTAVRGQVCTGSDPRSHLFVHRALLTVILVSGNRRLFYALILRFPQGVLQLALERGTQGEKQANKVTDNFPISYVNSI
jgi:hypothetical protein